MQAQLYPIENRPAEAHHLERHSRVEDEFAEHVASLKHMSSIIQKKQEHTDRDTHWGRKGALPKEWSYYDTPRRTMPFPYGGDRGPAYAEGGALEGPWERPLEGGTMGEVAYHTHLPPNFFMCDCHEALIGSYARRCCCYFPSTHTI